MFNTSHDVVNMEELLMCNKMSQPLSKSANPKNCKSIYDGMRGYSGSKIGYKVEGHSNLMKHQGPDLHTGIQKVINVEISFIRCQVFLSIRVLILERRLIIVVNMVKFLITLQNLFNSRLFRIHRKKTNIRYVGKSLVTHPI